MRDSRPQRVCQFGGNDDSIGYLWMVDTSAIPVIRDQGGIVKFTGTAVSPGVLEFAKLGGNPADLNGDGMIDAADAQIMFANWGTSAVADINGDGVVDAGDAGELFANWTGDPQPTPLPEPASFAFPALALFVVSLRSRRRVANRL